MHSRDILPLYLESTFESNYYFLAIFFFSVLVRLGVKAHLEKGMTLLKTQGILIHCS